MQTSKTHRRFQQFKTSNAMMQSNPWKMTPVVLIKIVVVTTTQGKVLYIGFCTQLNIAGSWARMQELTRCNAQFMKISKKIN